MKSLSLIVLNRAYAKLSNTAEDVVHLPWRRKIQSYTDAHGGAQRFA